MSERSNETRQGRVGLVPAEVRILFSAVKKKNDKQNKNRKTNKEQERRIHS